MRKLILPLPFEMKIRSKESKNRLKLFIGISSERATIAEWQGASEDQKFVAKPTQSNMKLFFTNGIIRYLLIFLALICVERFCHWKTKGFRICKIQSDLSPNLEWEIPELSQEENAHILQVLDQPYTFLGAGAQCYAFLSKDGEHVIKFFKHHHMRPNSFLNRLPLSEKWHLYRLKLTGGNGEKLEAIFNSCKIAYEDLREETGIEFIHLNKTEGKFGNLTIIDRIGIAYQLPLDSYEFVLQKRAVPLYAKLKEFKKAGDLKSIQETIDSIFHLFVKRFRNHISDRDPIFKRNFGMIGTQVVEFDQSSFYRNEELAKPYVFKRELFYEMLKLQKWIHKYIPEAKPYFDQRYSAWVINPESS